MYVMLLVVMLANGDLLPMVRGTSAVPQTYATLKICEESLKQDEATEGPSLVKQGFTRFKFSCILKSDYEEMVRLGKKAP